MELMMSSNTTTIAEKLKIFAIGAFFGFFLFSFFATTSVNFPRVDQIFVARTISSTDHDGATMDATTTSTTTGDMIRLHKDHYKLGDTASSSTPVQENPTILPQILVSSKTSKSKTPTTTTSTKTTINSSNSTAPTTLPPLHGESSSSSILLIEQPSLTTNSDQSKSYGGADHDETKRRKSSCNIYDGKWIYKPSESPVYDADDCPLLTVSTSCQKNGRPDSEYLGWNWKPNDCNIPLFNGTYMLERFRGKKMIFVGDSINHNQWLSLACLIYTSIPPSRRHTIQFKPNKFFFIVKEYDFTLEFHMSAFLVHINYKHTSGRRVLQLDTMDPLSKRWRDADILVFNSAHWWDHPRQIRQWDVVEYKGQIIDDMPKEAAYKHALTTWSKWITKKVNPNKTTVFFRSNSPAHNGKLWCFKATRPILDNSFLSFYPRSMVEVAEKSISRLSRRFPIKYQNITLLSGYRRDAHPSLYIHEKSKLKELMKEKGSLEMVAKHNADCSHWCLPGLPDTWNRLLYASLFFYG